MGQDSLNLEELKIDKLVNGGQGIGRLADGRVAFVWNALPGETVKARIVRKKRSYVEAIAEEIIESSSLRVKPKDEAFLSTSPWQILEPEGERQAKLGIVTDLFSVIDEMPKNIPYYDSPKQWYYRNKMEYSFWGDEEGLHLALHFRGSKLKRIVPGSSLAQREVDAAAISLLGSLQGVRASKLKTVVIRSSQDGKVVASLFVTEKEFPKITLPSSIQGLKVYYSNPKSPASVMTDMLYEQGETVIEDGLMGKKFRYDADSFFQVNLGVYEKVLKRIKEELIQGPLVDMYSGVGTIGLSMGVKGVKLIEVAETSSRYAKYNILKSGLDAELINAGAEQSLQYIPAEGTVVFDPPRAGLNVRIVKALLEQRPSRIIYLSCNPATLVRDIGYLREAYSLKSLEVFNFFPKTPHIETLAVLEIA